MIRILAAAGVLLAGTPVIAQPASALVTADSGIAFPAEVDGLPMMATGRLDDPLNSARSYGRDGETVTVYIFRAASPNAALWFERADSSLNANWKSRGIGAAGPVTSFALGGGATPNGQRRSYAVTGATKSTALAVSQVGTWIVKVRSSSDTLDPAAQDVRLDRIVRSIQAPDAGPVHPLTVPERCAQSESSIQDLAAAEIIFKPKTETIILAGAYTAVAAGAAAGARDSVAANPELWCRADIREAGPVATIYRRRTNTREWIALFADSGTTIAGVPMGPLDKGSEAAGGLLVTATWAKADAVLISKGVPPPEIALQAGAQHILGGGPPLASVPYGGGAVTLNIASETAPSPL